jgi:putative FmdB family regulatory protein
MPTYAYACTACDHRFEAVQSFSDDALSVCPECSGRLRKVFGAVGVVFKGSGFYRTDSRSTSSNGATKKAESSTSPAPAKESKTASSSTSSTSSSSTTSAA